MPRILVVGNVNADRVVRLKAPWRRGDDIGGEDLGFRLGGAAANAASALCHAGHAVALVGCIGTDAAGDHVARALARWPWDANRVARIDGPTARCLILVEPDGERTIVSLEGQPQPVAWPPLDLAGVAAVYVASRTPAPAMLFETARARGIPLVWQLRPGHRPAASPDVVVASQAAFGTDDPWSAIAAQGLACRWLVVTRGACGATAMDGTTRLDLPARPATVVDTTGAGDAFAGGLVHGLASGWALGSCLEIAIAWGALAVAHEGSTAPATIADRVTAGEPG